MKVLKTLHSERGSTTKWGSREIESYLVGEDTMFDVKQ